MDIQNNPPTSSNPPGDYDTYDSAQKLKTLEPKFKEVSEKTGVPVDVLEALFIKESRGKSINFMNTPGNGNFMQMDEGTYNDLANGANGHPPHPELKNYKFDSMEGQMLAAAYRLKDMYELHGKKWEEAAHYYNSGDGGQLNDPNYVTEFTKIKNAIDNGGPIPS
jgi:hypothetical protein